MEYVAHCYCDENSSNKMWVSRSRRRVNFLWIDDLQTMYVSLGDISLFRGFVIPKVRYFELSILGFVIPKVRYSEYTIRLVIPMVRSSEYTKRFVIPN